MPTWIQDSHDTDSRSLYRAREDGDSLGPWYRYFQGNQFSTGHVLIGNTPTGITVKLKRYDSPNNVYTIAHRSSSGTITILASMSTSAIGTSFADYSFTFTNCPTMADGDSLGVYVSGYSGESSSLWMRMGYQSSDVASNCVYIQKADDQDWVTDSNKDCYMSVTYDSSSGGGGSGEGEGEGEGSSGSDGSISGDGGSSYTPEYAMKLNIGYIR